MTETTNESEVTETIQESEVSDGELSAQETQKESNKVTFDEAQQKVLDKIVARQSSKALAAQQEAEKLRKDLEEVRQQIPKSERPEIPALPDIVEASEDELKAAIQRREEAIKAQQEFDRKERERSEAELRQAQSLQEQKQRQAVEQQQKFAQRSQAANIPLDKLHQFASSLDAIGLDPAVENVLFTDEKGPQMIKYLAENPAEAAQFTDLSGTNLIDFGVKMSDIRDKATKAIKEQLEKLPPDPDKPLPAGSAEPNPRSKLIAGATFKRG